MYRKELESLVSGILREKGLSYREVGRLTELDHTTIMELSKGRVQSKDTLIKFARAFDIPRQTILEAAGMVIEAE